MAKKRLAKRDDKDIPKSTVLVLVFLAVLISILGTWTVLTTIDDVFSNSQTSRAVYQESDAAPTGNVVGLTVEERSDGKNG